MKARCDNKNKTDASYYSSKGISYCPTWQSFVSFYNDMFDSYSDNLTLDRIDPNKDYSKDNCRWADRQTQAIQRNSFKNCTSNFKGVSFRKSNLKWVAQIQYKGFKTHIGYFEDEVSAALAYNSAALSLFGADAPINIIEIAP
jgi:hypothetical protein